MIYSIFIIDVNRNLVYKQLVPEISEEPDYDEVINFIDKLI